MKTAVDIIENEKPEIIFVFPRLNDAGNRIKAFTYSLGSGYIRAYLKQRQIASLQYINYSPGTVREVALDILSYGSNWVGFTCFDDTLYYCSILASELKKLLPEILIVFGGPSTTLADMLIMEHCHAVDVCSRRDGELTCYDLLQKYRSKENFRSIRGITFRAGREIVRNPDRVEEYCAKRENELDVLPSPYLTGMFPVEVGDGNVPFDTAVLTARGCTHKCTYCTNAAINMFKIRYHSIDRVIDEIGYLASNFAIKKPILFFDDAFTLNIVRAKKICRRIIEAGLDCIRFECITRIDKCDEELFHLMVQAGFQSVAFGLESASVKVLNLIKKVRNKRAVNNDYTPEKRFLDTMQKNIRYSLSFGLSAVVSIISGLPGETAGEMRTTLDFIKELNVPYYNHNYLNVIYGTELFRTCDDYGIQIIPSPFLLPFKIEFAYDVFSVPPLPNSIVHHTLREEDVRFNRHFISVFNTNNDLFTDESIVVIDSTKENDSALYSWLSVILHFNSSLFIVDEYWTYKAYTDRFELFSRFCVPAISYKMVKKSDNGRGFSNKSCTSYMVRSFLETILQTKHYTFQGEIPSEFTLQPYDEDVSVPANEGRTIILFFDSADQIEDYLTIKISDINEIVLDKNKIRAKNFLLLNKCRWTYNGKCGVYGLNKLIVRNGKIHPCYTDCPVGNVGDKPEAIKLKLETIRKETEKKRGCKDCALYEKCARCLFLPPFLTDEQYCRIMKQYRNDWAVWEIPGLIFEMIKSNILDSAMTERMTVTWLNLGFTSSEWRYKPDISFPDGLLQVSVDGKHYFYYTMKMQFMKLSDVMKRIWDEIHAGVYDWPAIYSHLAGCLSISETACKNAYQRMKEGIAVLHK
ncbi:MAG: B12-binding domain-containing radical SAM protein [Spirochaetales bacterium]|nr:B12-binding domain-containing radical SAM protein [Spirochaetales bacterium]